jgi:hypothetical protein
VPVLVTAGGIQGCGAVPGREPALVSEPRDVTDVTEEPHRARGADAMQREQAAAGRGHQLLELGAGGLDPPVGPRQLGDQLGGEPAAGLPCDVTRADRGQQFLRLRGGQELLRPAGEQLQQ